MMMVMCAGVRSRSRSHRVHLLGSIRSEVLDDGVHTQGRQGSDVEKRVAQGQLLQHTAHERPHHLWRCRPVGGGYQTGMFSPSLGIRIIRCPHEVANQQIAKLFALDAATRVAARLGWTKCTYVGDNAASLQMVHTMRPSLHNTVICQILRRIRNRLLWTAMTVHLLWVPSGLQPGDPSS